MRAISLMIGCAVLLITATSGMALPVDLTVQNASFEEPVLDPGDFVSNTDYTEGDRETPHWWMSAPSINQGGIVHLTTSPPSASGLLDAQPAYDGANALFLHGDTSVRQTLTEVVWAGEYTLNVWVSHRDTDVTGPLGPNDYGIELLVDGSPATAASMVLPTTDGGTWQLATATYVFGNNDPLLGGTLGIRLSSDGVQQLFDDVSLTYIPEPASMALLALGSVFLLRRRR